MVVFLLNNQSGRLFNKKNYHIKKNQDDYLIKKLPYKEESGRLFNKKRPDSSLYGSFFIK
jgi:hypothetical protein